MPVEMLTYAALSERLGCSAEAARALVKRLRLPSQRANNGKALVAVDLAEINHTPTLRAVTRRSPDDHQAVVGEAVARIAGELAAFQARPWWRRLVTSFSPVLSGAGLDAQNACAAVASGTAS